MFVAKVSFISFNYGFDTLSICEDCLIYAAPRRVGESPAEATVLGWPATNRLVVSVNELAN